MFSKWLWKWILRVIRQLPILNMFAVKSTTVENRRKNEKLFCQTIMISTCELHIFFVALPVIAQESAHACLWLVHHETGTLCCKNKNTNQLTLEEESMYSFIAIGSGWWPRVRWNYLSKSAFVSQPERVPWGWEVTTQRGWQKKNLAQNLSTSSARE